MSASFALNPFMVSRELACKKGDFLEEKKPLENLIKLANPKLFMAPDTSCITKSVFQKIPRFDVSREAIQKSVANGALSLFLLQGILHPRNLEIELCLYKDPKWISHFFTSFYQCSKEAIQDIVQPDQFFPMLFRTYLIGICAIGTYVVATAFFTDYRANRRIEMLSREYSEIGRVLTIRFEKAQKWQKGEIIKEIKEIAARLEANVPLIEAHLKKVARLSPQKASLFGSYLSQVARRVLSKEEQR